MAVVLKGFFKVVHPVGRQSVPFFYAEHLERCETCSLSGFPILVEMQLADNLLLV